MVNYSLRARISNKNVVLICVLVALVGMIIAFWVGSLFDTTILESGKTWEKALKFTTENAEEFPYSVKTQQGDLYATGPVFAASPLVTHDNLGGEYMAITEVREEYRKHTEHYSCNCDRDGNCDTCTRHYWSWDYNGQDFWSVDTISLLGQEMPASMIDWKRGYVEANTKNGERFVYSDSTHRRYYDVIYGPVTGSWGFRSDENGFVRNPDLHQPALFFPIFFKVLSILAVLGLTGWVIYRITECLYEWNGDRYI